MKDNSPFDGIAENYDKAFSETVIGIEQRKRVWYFLDKYLKGLSSLGILEINCGTGIDAIKLSKLNHHVIATDISQKMIEVAMAKREAMENGNLKFVKAGFNELTLLFQGKNFDLVFSNFGGLNCVSKKDLLQLNNDFSSILKPNCKLIMVLLGKKCLLERLFFWYKGDTKKCKRRNSKAIAKLAPGIIQETYYYDIAEIKAIFSAFNLTVSKPIGLFIPPSYLNNYVKDKPKSMKLLLILEKLLGGISAFSNYGDHTYLVLEKK